MDSGYKLGSIIAISNKNTFNFIDAAGNCLASGTNNFNQQIRWRVNSDFTCNGVSNSINMFNSIFNQYIDSYSSTSEKQIQIPSPTSDYNQAIVYIFIGRFGSSST